MSFLDDLFKKPKHKSLLRQNLQYWNKDFIYIVKERWNHHRFFSGEKILVDIAVKEHLVRSAYNSDLVKIPSYEREDQWTSATSKSLNEAGYKRVVGLYDSILWWGVPVYIRFADLKRFDVHVKDDQGRYLWSQDTATTLNDAMQSQATKEFIKGMGKTAVSSMDMQKLAMMGIVAVGAVFGLMMMGVI